MIFNNFIVCKVYSGWPCRILEILLLKKMKIVTYLCAKINAENTMNPMMKFPSEKTNKQCVFFLFFDHPVGYIVPLFSTSILRRERNGFSYALSD